MKKMKIFKVYVDDGQSVFIVRVPAFEEKQVIGHCNGCGEVVAIKEEVDFPGISHDWLINKLEQTDMTVEERLLIARIVINSGLGF